MDLQLKYTEEEYQALKDTFEDNNRLLKAMLKSLFQIELNDDDNDALVRLDDSLKPLLKKIFLPALEDDVPTDWTMDCYDRVGGDMPLQVRTVENGVLQIKARKRVLQYCKYEFEKLFGNNLGQINFKSLENIDELKDEEIYTNFVTREEITNRVRGFIKELKNLSKYKKLTPEEIEEMQRKDNME
jgi:hypothetical protein